MAGAQLTHDLTLHFKDLADTNYKDMGKRIRSSDIIKELTVKADFIYGASYRGRPRNFRWGGGGGGPGPNLSGHHWEQKGVTTTLWNMPGIQ